MFSCSPKRWRRPASRPACRSRWRTNSRARPSPVRANCCTARRFDAATLRENVTSPGGTTAAALDVLMGRRRACAVADGKAVAAATERSRKLAG